MSVLFFALIAVQDIPVDIPKAQLPKTEHCVVCESNGEDHGTERPAAGVRYKGKAYYFCNAKEVTVFKKDPLSFMPPVLPRPMPRFELTDLGGKVWNDESLKGKVVLIDYWATWCVPCREMKPILDRLRKQFLDKDFEVLSVSIDEKRADLEKFLKKTKFDNPVLHDQKQTWANWRIRVVPTFFLVKESQIIGQWSGKPSEKTLSSAIQRATMSKVR
ncbi:MAG: redoxin domain-containing protein [Fimbriimonadaceae bacterium]|nr:redoxin domain-containing protein [Fimbriimonadaceae bacterium]